MAKQSNKGFTIIEVVITIAIGAAVMALVLNAVAGARRSQRNNARTADVNQIAAAANQYLATRNALPQNWGHISGIVDNAFGHYDVGAATVAAVPASCSTGAVNAAGTGCVTAGATFTAATPQTTTTKSINPTGSWDGTDPNSGGVFFTLAANTTATTPPNAANAIGATGSTTGATEAPDKVVLILRTACTGNGLQIESGGIREMVMVYRLEGQDAPICLEI